MGNSPNGLALAYQALVEAGGSDQQTANFEAVLAHMSQGVCMFDSEQQLILCNRQYMDIYQLPESLAKPGVTLREILQSRIAQGNFPKIEPEVYIDDRMQAVINATPHTALHELRDGRVIAVGHEPMANGGWLTTHDDVSKIFSLQKEIIHLAFHDQVTGLPNRRKLHDVLTGALKRRETVNHFALLYIDLDDFKQVNDTLGHAAGDSVLSKVADRLMRCITVTDLVARIGGDEFAIVLNSVVGIQDVEEFADKVIAAISAPQVIQKQSVKVGASIGIVHFHGQELTCDDMLKGADTAMYSAKRSGGRCCNTFAPHLSEL